MNAPITATPESPALPDETAAGIVADRWPTLARALGKYERQTAEAFSQMAYDRVEGGIIRQSERVALGDAADDMGIQPFDAQLLIACSIRKWALDRRYDPSPSPRAPALSFEYKSWQRMWIRLTLIIGLAIALDGMILWKWLS